MKGRRLPVIDAKTFTTPTKPGDYSGPVDIGNGKTAVYFLLPLAAADPRLEEPGARSLHSVHQPPHRFRECEDGSLEIRESIGAYGMREAGASYLWHGYLDEGHVWREV